MKPPWIAEEEERLYAAKAHAARWKALAKDHPYWPTSGHPDTGEPFVDGSINADYPHDRFENHRPTRPLPRVETKAMVVEWDGEEEWYEPTEYRDATEEEYAAMLADYEKALAEWTRTMGIVFVAGPTVITGEFRCESGSTARGMRDEVRGWFWQAWDTKRR